MSNSSIQTVFFDAAGTLFHLKEPVGQSYGRIAAIHGIHTPANTINAAFKQAWKQLPQPVHENGPAADDDKSWWKQIVKNTFEAATGKEIPSEALSSLFEDLYAHFAKADAWQLYPDTLPVLKKLRGRFPLYVLSNFDRRLYGILEGLDIAHFFNAVILSSETGASKPHPRIFKRALEIASTPASNCLHVGDHPEYDFSGASQAGFQCLLLNRPDNDLHDVAERLA